MQKKTGLVVSVLGAVAVNIALLGGTAGADDLPWTGPAPEAGVAGVTSFVSDTVTTLGEGDDDNDLPWTK
ncbi:hypothetical protein [Streptomyces sp. cg35]|uniref:hypothetical protein n=1 Tax=Streptomyces sp. cg35 TaxID=3421650 RepID=UPI003D16FEEF